MTRRRTAVHEAGHGVVALVHGIEVRHITVEPRPGMLGHCQTHTKREDLPFPAAVSYLLAGPAAERIEAPYDADHGASLDREQARALIARELRANGKPEATAGWDLVTWQLWQHERLAADVVCRNWDWVRRTASELDRRTTLTGQQISRLRWGWE